VAKCKGITYRVPIKAIAILGRNAEDIGVKRKVGGILYTTL